MAASLDQFSQVVALIHEAGAAPERWTDALVAIVGLVRGARGSLMDVSADANVLLDMRHIGHDPANAKAYAEHYFAIDPTRALAVTTPALKALTVYEQFSRNARARHEYFDFARRIDVGDVVGVGTPVASGRRALISVQRSVEAPAYDPEEKQLFQLLASHVAIAKRVQGCLGEAWSEKSELEAAFGKLAAPAFVVDSEGRIRHLNHAANTLMMRSVGVGCRGGRLAFADPKAAAPVRAAIRQAAREPGHAAAVPVVLDGEPGEVLVTPLQAAHGAAAAWRVPLALVVVAIGPEDEHAIAWRMQQLYRLTPAEGRIVAALAAGKTVDEIARRRRVSDATLRTQLRSIFGKTGTRRQAELVYLALRGSGVRHQT